MKLAWSYCVEKVLLTVNDLVKGLMGCDEEMDPPEGSWISEGPDRGAVSQLSTKVVGDLDLVPNRPLRQALWKLSSTCVAGQSSCL